jgi:hypothetical protein
MNCRFNCMTTDVRKTEIHEFLERHHVRYEVRPYYVVWDQRPVGGRPTEQRVQAGFDVDLYGALDTWQLPLFSSEEARNVVNYFESVAEQIQSEIGQHCTVEVIPYADSVTLDTHEHFRPEGMASIRISHDRGLDQPAGPSEERALKMIQETLHELGVKSA